MLTPWEKFKARFGKDPKALETAGITQASFEEAVTAEPAPGAATVSDPALAAQIAAFESDRHMLRTKLLNEEAAKFANDLVYNQKRAMVSQLASIEQMYKMAANADGGGVAQFSNAGDVVAGENVKALVAHFAAQPALSLFGEKIKDAARTEQDNDRDSRTAARNAAAMARLNKEGN